MGVECVRVSGAGGLVVELRGPLFSESKDASAACDDCAEAADARR